MTLAHAFTEPASKPSSPFEPIHAFDDSNSAAGNIGAELRLIREAAPRFRKWFRETGMPEYVETFPLAAVPYPTRFGLHRAHRTPAPLVTMTNRLVVIRWKDARGGRKTFLFEPSDVELGENVPFYRALSDRTPKFLRRFGVTKYDDVATHVRKLGIDPAEVDYLAFDHLHVQDVRRLVGTNSPAADISPNAKVPPLFPNAKLLVQASELELIREMHPLQAPWYQPATFRDLREGSVVPLHGDVLLGPGVALVETPGHATGNMSLVLNTDSGIWAMSENVIAAELLTPEVSDIPGVRQAAARWGVEAILNGNTLEATARQYNSVVKEKLIVDRSRKDSRFLQFFPSSELTKNPVNVGTAPTFVHGRLSHGRLVRES
ncbi:MAG TPA: hypothetical protein VHE30_18560 [Polyangiaceae bacterium]|nr:hypothetical protein [Polyangiaceae bacterium]